MRVTVVGCSGSFPGPDSPASCYLVQATDGTRTWNIALDLGNGSLGVLQRYVDLADLDAVVLSHLHPDHCVDLCGLYVARRYHPGEPFAGRLPVHGPAGTAQRMARIYGLSGGAGMEGQFSFHTVSDRRSFVVGPMTMTPVRVNHLIEAYGYRVEVDGVVLAYTGDTDADPALSALLTGADLALLDSAFVEGRDDATGIHLSGRRAAEAAVAAGGVKRFVLTHLPPWNDPEVSRAEAGEVWPGDVELASSGAVYEL